MSAIIHIPGILLTLHLLFLRLVIEFIATKLLASGSHSQLGKSAYMFQVWDWSSLQCLVLLLINHLPLVCPSSFDQSVSNDLVFDFVIGYNSFYTHGYIYIKHICLLN